MQLENQKAFIHIVGMNMLQNNLLLLFLKEKTNLMGRCISKLESTRPINENKSILTQLFLFDYDSIDRKDFWPKLFTWQRIVASQHLVALCNIESEMEVEKTALKNKIQGLFYKNDTPQVIAKGVSAILEGDLWYSRKSLKRYIVESNPSTDISEHVDSYNLTVREREILSLISAGYSNKKIADNLCISIHTVKAHIYNIYKKINISNRLQAALWAAKFL